MKETNLTIILVALLLVGGFLYYTNMNSEKTTISVTGQSTINAVADEVSIYIGIETLKDTTEESKDANSIISDKVLRSLYFFLDKENVETSSYNIYPEYDYTNNGQKIKGYKTSNILKIKVKDFKKIGRIVDSSISSGATSIQSINFELSDEKQNEIKKEAIAKASEDARVKGESAAQGLNAKLGKIKNVVLNDYNYYPLPYYRMDGDIALEKAVNTEIIPTKLDVNANVNVVFEIK